MNNPARFKIYRLSESQDASEPLRLMAMRKGIADIEARASVSTTILDRFVEQMSTVKEKMPLGELLGSVDAPLINDGKRTRALDVFGKDKELLRAISDPAFNVHAITNSELQAILKGASWVNGMDGRRLSGRITRHLALLRKHGIIKQLPRQRKYVLTDKGRSITTALNVSLAASVERLLDSAA